MIRPVLLLAAAAIVAGASGCARTNRAPPPGAAAPLPPVAGRSGSPAANRDPAFAAPPPSQAVRDRAEVADACRREANQALRYRDRGQLMRDDERDARVGTDSSIYAGRAETDRLGRAFERDRIVARCLEQDSRPPPRR